MESGQHTSKSISAQQIYPYKFGTPYKLGISVLPLVYIFFLPLLELQNQVQTIPMPIPNAIYRIKSSSVDLNFPRQHRLLLEDNFIRVEIFMLPFLGFGCNKMVVSFWTRQGCFLILYLLATKIVNITFQSTSCMTTLIKQRSIR